MPQQHPFQVREKAINKVLTKNGTKRQIAQELGIGLSTLQRWIREVKKSGDYTVQHQEKRPQDWSKEDRLNALIESSKISNEELGAWCRQKGLHTHHLDNWRKDFIQDQSNSQQASEFKEMKKKVKDLEKEINRKDKALAETSALLVLKKKAAAIWGDQEAD